MPNGHMGPAYTIRIRHREQWEATVHRGGIAHRRRVKRWGAWKTWRVARTAVLALDMRDQMRDMHRLSDVGVFFGGKRLTSEQVARRAQAEEANAGGGEDRP